MKILRYLLPAAFVAVLGASGASASAFPVQNTLAIDTSKIEIQYGDHRNDMRRDRRGPQMQRRGPPPNHALVVTTKRVFMWTAGTCGLRI